MSKILYSLDNVIHSYAGHVVLDVPQLEIGAGVVTGIAGPNGSGKSSLMRLLAFVENPAQGEIFFMGQKGSISDYYALRREVTLLTQDSWVLQRSVAANVGYGLKIRGRGVSFERVAEALSMVGLVPDQFADRPWHALSGGETRRVALAARLVLRPHVLLLDEPTAGLDEESTDHVYKAVLKARTAWNASIVIVSHDMDWLHTVCNSIIFLKKAKVADYVKKQA